METAKPSKPTKPKRSKKPSAAAGAGDDMDAIRSEVASFASSLGLIAGGGGGGGFDDSDFRKPDPIKPPNPNPETPQNPTETSKPKPKKPHPLELTDPFAAAAAAASTSTNYPLMKPSGLSGQWYADAGELEARVLGGKAQPPSLGLQEMQRLVEGKREVADRLMAQYAKEYEAARRRRGDMKLLETSARSGTSADKVSAFTCLVEDNPIANMRALDALLGMITSKVGKRYAFTGFDALKELFLTRLLPDRKLKTLFQRPLSSLPETKDGYSLLLFWHWEECLKQRYEKFVIALEEAIKDMLPNLKDKAMKTVFILLKTKSEQERRLLTAIVNKLGDPERKVASSAAYHLSCLLSAHPNMKMVVIDEVDSFLFRPHVGLRAKYQAVNFLNQILLSKRGDGPKIAKRLVDVYFAVFKVLMSDPHDNKGPKNSKHGRRNGENRKVNGKNKKVKGPTSHPNHEEDSSVESNSVMDSRLLSALLTGVNRAFPYVASSEADDIVEVQTPILFRLVHSENFNVGVQALMLLYQISTKNQIASDRFYRALYAKLLSPAAVTSSKPELFLGLLVKAMKNDINLKRVAAFAKRMLQVALERPPQYACGCLFILSELLKVKSPLWTTVLQSESVDDEIEHFEDIIESPEDSGVASAIPDEHGNKLVTLDDADSDAEDGSGSRQRAKLIGNGQKEETGASNGGSTLAYNPRHREPSYCNADLVGWWELTILASHVHPSVATWARTLLSGANIVYNGDPLNDLSLPAFLDKFMEKKPKGNRLAEGKWHGGSQIAPARKLDMNPRLIGEELLELAENEVPPEDVVFHRFYKNKTGPMKPKAKKTSIVDDDAEELLPDDVNDESDDEEMQLLGGGHALAEPEDGEYDYDDLDSHAFEEEQDLLGDGSDVEVDVLPDHSTRGRGGPESDDDDDDVSLDISDVDAEAIDDIEDDTSDEEMIEAVDCVADAAPKAVAGGKKRKLGAKSGASPFASLEDYEHLMDGEKQKNSRSQKHKKIKGGDEEKPRKSRSQKHKKMKKSK